MPVREHQHSPDPTCWHVRDGQQVRLALLQHRPDVAATVRPPACQRDRWPRFLAPSVENYEHSREDRLPDAVSRKASNSAKPDRCLDTLLTRCSAKHRDWVGVLRAFHQGNAGADSSDAWCATRGSLRMVYPYVVELERDGRTMRDDRQVKIVP